MKSAFAGTAVLTTVAAAWTGGAADCGGAACPEASGLAASARRPKAAKRASGRAAVFLDAAPDGPRPSAARALGTPVRGCGLTACLAEFPEGNSLAGNAGPLR